MCKASDRATDCDRPYGHIYNFHGPRRKREGSKQRHLEIALTPDKTRLGLGDNTMSNEATNSHNSFFHPPSENAGLLVRVRHQLQGWSMGCIHWHCVCPTGLFEQFEHSCSNYTHYVLYSANLSLRGCVSTDSWLLLAARKNFTQPLTAEYIYF